MAGKLLFIKKWGIARSFYSYVMSRLSWKTGFSLAGVYCRALNVTKSAPSLEAGQTLKVLDEKELLSFCADPRLELNKVMITTWLSRGNVCIGILDYGELVAYTWRAFSSPHIDEIWVEFSNNMRYGYAAFTLPEYRGKQLTKLLTWAGDKLCEMPSKTHHIATIDTHNYSSIRATLKKGGRLVGYTCHFSILGKFFEFRTLGVKAVGFRHLKKNPPIQS